MARFPLQFGEPLHNWVRRRRSGGRGGRASAGGWFRSGRGRRSTIRISSWSCEAWAMTRPKGSAAKAEPPQNSIPPSGGTFVADPVDGDDVDAVADGMGALHRVPGVGLRGAELRPSRRGASRSRWGRRGSRRRWSAVRRAASGYHWSQQTRVPTVAWSVRIAWKPRSPGVK